MSNQQDDIRELTVQTIVQIFAYIILITISNTHPNSGQLTIADWQRNATFGLTISLLFLKTTRPHKYTLTLNSSIIFISFSAFFFALAYYPFLTPSKDNSSLVYVFKNASSVFGFIYLLVPTLIFAWAFINGEYANEAWSFMKTLNIMALAVVIPITQIVLLLVWPNYNRVILFLAIIWIALFIIFKSQKIHHFLKTIFSLSI